MAAIPGTTAWSFRVVGGGPQFDSPFIDGDKLDAVNTWTVTNPGRGVRRQTLANSHVIQASLQHALATIDTRAPVVAFNVNVKFEEDWQTIKESRASVRFTALWPVTDIWGLTGEAGQRTTFFLARTLPWEDITFAQVGAQLDASFKPNVGAEVPLTVITVGIPTSTELLVPSTISDPSFTDAADYTVTSGDLEANGPGRLRLRYNPTRFGTLTVGDAVPTSNALTFAASFAEALPLRRWEDSI